jgi:hypothetical protein
MLRESLLCLRIFNLLAESEARGLRFGYNVPSSIDVDCGSLLGLGLHSC